MLKSVPVGMRFKIQQATISCLECFDIERNLETLVSVMLFILCGHTPKYVVKSVVFSLGSLSRWLILPSDGQRMCKMPKSCRQKHSWLATCFKCSSNPSLPRQENKPSSYNSWFLFFGHLAPVFFPFLKPSFRSYSQMFHIPTEPWTNLGTPVYFRGTAVFCRGSGHPKTPLNYAPNFGSAKVKWKQVKKGGKKGCI